LKCRKQVFLPILCDFAVIWASSIPKTYTWTGENTNIATVDANGLVTVKGTGTTLIIANSGGAEDTIKQIDNVETWRATSLLTPYIANGKKLVKIGTEFSKTERGLKRWMIEVHL